MRNLVRTSARAALFLVALTGCGSDPAADEAGFEVRDSAGVRMVSNAQVESPLTSTEVIRVGVVDGDPRYQFNDIRTITVDADGGFWVVDGNESVRHYDNAGELVGSVGGRGGGPGESEMYYSATLRGDSVLLLGVPGVMQLFDADGSLLGSASRSAGGYRQPVGVAGGRWLFRQQAYPTDQGEVFRSPITYLAAPSLDAPADTLRSFQGELRQVQGLEGGFPRIGRASWFRGNPSFAVDGQGRIFVSDTLAYRVETYDPAGRLARVLERPAEPRAFEEAWLAEVEVGFEEAMSHDGGPMDRDRIERQMASATPDPAPEHLPFIEGLLVGPDGELWVERADRHPNPALRAVAHQYGYVRHAWLPTWAAPRVFDIFDAEGRYEGTVELPDDFAPMAIVGNRVYGVHYDHLDVERVVVHEIGPGA